MDTYHKLTAQQKAEIIARAKNGEKGGLLSKEFGVTGTTVYRLLSRNGVQPSRKALEDKLQTVPQLYLEGHTIREIAAHLQCTEVVCARKLVEQGIEVRSQKADLMGRTFGDWEVVSPVEAKGATRWVCRCSCGVVRNVRTNNLLNGRSTNCGCRNIAPNIRSYELNESYFSRIDTPEKAFYLGWIWADGCIQEVRRLKFNVSSKDEKLLEDFNKAIGSNMRITNAVKQINGKPYLLCSLQINSRPMVNDLMSHGLTPKKSLTIDAWHGPEELMRHYWHGVWVGDGHITQSGKYWNVGLCGNESVVNAFADFARKHTSTKASVCCDTKGRTNPLWRFSVGGLKAPKELMQLMLKDAPVVLERKYQKALAMFSEQ